MVEVNWGERDDPGYSGGRGIDRRPVLSDLPEAIPGVAAARRHGYFPAPEAPLWCFVPAIWPVAWRAWTRDTRIRHQTIQCGDGAAERLPWSTADHADHEQDTNALLSELGLPPRPPGRVWLLRAPHPYADPQSVLDDIWGSWRSAGGPAMATAELVAHADRRLRGIFR